MVFLTTWLVQYGYGVLFIALFLEMLALPFPGEMLMSYTGLLIFEGKLNGFLCIVSAGAGVTAGMTLSYWIGFRLGKPFFIKYGSRLHLGPEKIDRMSVWLQKYGNKLLVIAYFIPGVRHITGYFCGVTRMPFRKYAVYAYSGAFLWVSLFISLGKMLGPKWELYQHTINRYMIMAGIISGCIFILVYLYRKYKRRIFSFAVTSLEKGVRHFNSLGKVRVLVLASFAVFILFFFLMLGLIQDFMAHEFALFDEVTSYMVHNVFGPGWYGWMDWFALMGSYYFFIPIVIITAIWIIFQGKDRLLELIFLVWVIIGGEVLDEVLRKLFHRSYFSNGFQFFNTFPSEESLTSLTVCGFAAFLVFRHYGKSQIRIAVTLCVIILCLLIGLSRIYFKVQFPSDVAAGYVFGGCWFSLNVILLEILRILLRLKKQTGIENAIS